MYAIADIVIISSSKIIFRHCYKLFLTSISCYEEEKDSENAVDAAIEELIEMNILIYYRFVDMLYFVDAICSYVYSYKTPFLRKSKCLIAFPSTFFPTSVFTSLFFLCIILSQFLTLGLFFQSRRRSFISCI